MPDPQFFNPNQKRKDEYLPLFYNYTEAIANGHEGGINNNFWSPAISVLIKALNSSEQGLTAAQAKDRLKQSGVKGTPNRFENDIRILLAQFKSPLVLILLGAIILALSLGDFTNSIIVLVILSLTGILGFIQERNAGRAIEKLQSLVRVTALVKRDNNMVTVPLAEVVPGDIVLINAGDIIPGDGRLISCNDLHVNEAALTGESFPREKSVVEVPANAPLMDRKNCVFKGTNVMNGTGVVLIVFTGTQTILGQITLSIANGVPLTAFEKGTRQLGYLLLQLTLTFSVIILLLNLYMGKPMVDSTLFALALAVGITPELLPAIITIALARGAKRMAEKNVIVKKLNAIHNLGSLDTFCVDKTGTLTEGTVKVYKAVDVLSHECEKVLLYAVYNAKFETGFSNPIDVALRSTSARVTDVSKLDEIPYDFFRKRLSVVIKYEARKIMITKGAVKNIVSVCSSIEVNNEILPLATFKTKIEQDINEFGHQGFRAIAICYKDVSNEEIISKADETEMIFLGYILLHDPPRAAVEKSLRKLNDAGVGIKLITGDNASIASYLGGIIGLDTKTVLTGQQLRVMTDEALLYQLGYVSIFAETEPDQKERIVRTLQKAGHTVGFIGDGINDVSAIRTADVGISVDSAADVAKETADIVLLEKGLDVLYDGIMEGRKTFVNSLKYIFITTSANFGNMFSVAGASLLLPFLPLLPKQILLINFLTDLPAMTLASDTVEREALAKPGKWNNKLIRNFMLVFGMQSTLFDFLTFFTLYYIFGATPEKFRTGWFLECVVTELLILMVVRTTRPAYKSTPGRYLVIVSLLAGGITVLTIFSPLREWFGFESLNPMLLGAIVLITLLYVMTAEITKWAFFKRYRIG